MPHELVDNAEFYDNRRESNDDLDDTLSAAWDGAQELADEKQVSKDFVAGEIDRRGSTEDEVWEAAFDSSVMTKEARDARHAAAAGNPPDRPPAKLTKKAADEKAYTDHLSREWDKRAGTPVKPAEARPEAAPPQPDAGGMSPEDRAALDKAPPETRAMIDRHVATHRDTYGAVDELGAKWSSTLAQRGAATPAAQVQHLDGLLHTEHTLATGSPEQKIRAMQEIAQAYGVGQPSGAPQAQARMQAPPAPQASRTGNPEHDRLVDQLGRDEHSQQLDAWRQAMQQAGPEAQRQQTIHRAQQHIAAVASERTPDGKPVRPYFGAVQREIAHGIVMAQRAGQQPNIARIYDQAVASRPDIHEHKIANAHMDIRRAAEANPVIHDPIIRKQMNSIAAGYLRTGRTGDVNTVLAEALRRQPDIAARYAKQTAAAKQGGHAVMPTLDQSLEAAWAVGVGG